MTPPLKQVGSGQPSWKRSTRSKDFFSKTLLSASTRLVVVAKRRIETTVAVIRCVSFAALPIVIDHRDGSFDDPMDVHNALIYRRLRQ
jgi:hypothetical protein